MGVREKKAMEEVHSEIREYGNLIHQLMMPWYGLYGCYAYILYGRKLVVGLYSMVDVIRHQSLSKSSEV